MEKQKGMKLFWKWVRELVLLPVEIITAILLILLSVLILGLVVGSIGGALMIVLGVAGIVLLFVLGIVTATVLVFLIGFGGWLIYMIIRAVFFPVETYQKLERLTNKKKDTTVGTDKKGDKNGNV